MAKVIKVEDSGSRAKAIARAVSILGDGGLVAFPTETVYGIAAVVDRGDALGRLAKLKDRPTGKPFTLHVGQHSFIDRYVPRLSLLDREFLRKALPGAITVVFVLDAEGQKVVEQRFTTKQIRGLYHNGSIGIRLPDNDLACELILAAPGPIVAPSANFAGCSPATTAAEVIDGIGDHVELVIDAGPTKYSQSSTVVKIESGGLKVLREGVADGAALSRMRNVNILFVCTGNTCRSPMACGICQKYLSEKLGCSVDQLVDRGYNVQAAGVAAFGSSPASPEAIEACKGMGVDIGTHRSQGLSTELVNWADRIFVMTRSHMDAVRNVSPGALSRTFLLAGGLEVADPIGQSLAAYKACAKDIEASVQMQLDRFF